MLTSDLDRRAWAALALAVGLPLLVIVVDALTWRGVFDEGPPRLDVVALPRSLVLLSAVAALLWAVAPRTTELRWPRPARATIGGFTIAHAAIALLAVLDPQLLHRLGQEDGAVENLTALAFAVGGLLVASTWRRWHGPRRAVVLGYGGLMVLGGLEEISYGQRFIGFSGPDIVTRNNLQNEFTLHNLATDPTESAFYAGTALVLVLLPILVRGPGARLVSWAVPLAPTAWTAVAAAPAFALTHAMWDVVPVQLTFWTAVGVLALLVAQLGGAARTLTATVLLSTVVIQTLGVAVVDLVELHDLTEFKELVLGGLIVLQGTVMRRDGTAADTEMGSAHVGAPAG